MRAIFVSYRRDDAEGEAGRLFDDLVTQFGEDSVFMDVAAIEVGRDFRKAIDDSVATCGLLLAVIGREWIDAKNEAGQRRLDDPFDFVRLETASALKRDIPVVPVLVHGAKMPRADQLPDDLKELAFRNGVEVTHARWNSDVQLLFKALRPFVGESKGAPAAPSTPVPQPAAEVKPPVRVETKVPQVAAETSLAPKKKPMGIILAVVAAVLVVGAVGGYMMLASKKAQEEQRAAAEQKALADKAAADRAAAEQQALADKAVADKAAADRAAAERALAEEKAVADKAAADKAAAERAAAQKAAEQKAAWVQVPNLVGKSFDQARAQLQTSGLALGSTTSQSKPGAGPGTVLSQSPSFGQQVNKGARVDLTVASATQQKLPNFAGTWEMIGLVNNGVPQTIPKAQPVAITQNGALVRFGNMEAQITSAGTVTYKNFFAHKQPVQTEAQADLVDTVTWRVEGSILVCEQNINYKTADYGRPPGTGLRILKYKRVAP